MAQEGVPSRKQTHYPRGKEASAHVLSVWGTHRRLVQASVPLLLLHGPPAVWAHPQWQVQHTVALGSHGKGQFARSLNPTL